MIAAPEKCTALSGSARMSLPRRMPVWLNAAAFTAFAEEVEQALEGDSLRYSKRLRLIHRAQHFGIRRFDANLIIAMVQGRLEGRKTFLNKSDLKPRWGLLCSLAVFLVVQAAIIAGVWWVIG